MKSPRRPQDINQRFDETVAPCNCGLGMRFEREALALYTHHDATLNQAAQLVAWRYKLGIAETLHYFDALAGLRLAQ
jgi:hypothetical protein